MLPAEQEKTMRNVLHRLGCAGVCLATLAAPVAADEVADFYKAKGFNIVVGHEVGTGFDIYGRTLARHIGRHIPGNPNVVVQNMNGASGLTSANWLYNIAPKDGSVVATYVQSVPFEPLYGNAAARFDPAKSTWIGNLEESIGVCGVTKASGIGKFDDLLAKETIFAGTGTTGPLGKASLAVKNLLGAKIKLVTGYQGSASVKLAMNRGEVAGICGLPMSTITSFWKDDYESGNFKPIIQLSGRKQPQLAGLPHADDFAKSEEDRQVLGLIFGTLSLGRLYVSSPGVPKERANALRTAFMATAKDPAFLEDAVKTQIDVSPMTGEEVEAFIARISSSSPKVIERAKQAYRND
jgi:tripartite-type tricarboxylate transporter receptor subunit TctC